MALAGVTRPAAPPPAPQPDGRRPAKAARTEPLPAANVIIQFHSDTGDAVGVPLPSSAAAGSQMASWD